MHGSTGVIESPADAVQPQSAQAPRGVAGAGAGLSPLASAGSAAAAVAVAAAIAGGAPAAVAAPALSPDTFSPVRVERSVDRHVEHQLEQQVESVQRELDAVRQELDLVRRRDDTLSSYMRRIDEELRLAAKLQRDFLPKAMPEVGRVRFHTLFRPAGYVSGDLYDVMRLDERNVGFYLADAVGHGVPAALLTMFVKQALQTKEIIRGGAGNGSGGGATGSYRLLDPSESLQRLNACLIDQNLSHATFATALYGTIDVDTLKLTVSRAGHPAPIVLRADGSAEPLEPEGSLLGIFADETYDAKTIQLYPGDRVIAYTDGVEVAFWGTAGVDTQRWHDELMGYRNLSAAQLLSEFSDRIDREAGSLEPKDDLTIIIAEVQGDQG
jgi:sigma-B regulation protein RsbU (phosphoserine phosphatase)